MNRLAQPLAMATLVHLVCGTSLFCWGGNGWGQSLDRPNQVDDSTRESPPQVAGFTPVFLPNSLLDQPKTYPSPMARPALSSDSKVGNASRAVAGEARPASLRASLPHANLSTASSTPSAWARPTLKGLELSDSEGTVHQLSNYLESTLVLEWIDPKCPYTRRHHTVGTSQRFARHYLRQERVVWFGVCSDPKASALQVEQYRRRKGLPYPILLDPNGVLRSRYSAQTATHCFVIESDVVLYSGAFDNDPRGVLPRKTNYLARALDERSSQQPILVTRTIPYGTRLERSGPQSAKQ